MGALTWSGCRNVRDLGGMTTVHGHRIQERRLLRSDCLDKLDGDGHAALAGFGTSRVIDLRSDFEVDGTPHPLEHLDTGYGETADYLVAACELTDDELDAVRERLVGVGR